jgi:hypothetical protein
MFGFFKKNRPPLVSAYDSIHSTIKDAYAHDTNVNPVEIGLFALSIVVTVRILLSKANERDYVFKSCNQLEDYVVGDLSRYAPRPRVASTYKAIFPVYRDLIVNFVKAPSEDTGLDIVECVDRNALSASPPFPSMIKSATISLVISSMVSAFKGSN